MSLRRRNVLVPQGAINSDRKQELQETTVPSEGKKVRSQVFMLKSSFQSRLIKLRGCHQDQRKKHNDFSVTFLNCVLLLLPVAESDSEEEEEEDSEGEDGEDGEMSSQSSRRRYPSRSKNSRSTRLTRNSAGADRKRTGKHYNNRL